MSQSKKKAKQYEEHLNNYYSEELTLEQAAEELDYLTVKSRGKCCSPSSLLSAIRKGAAGTLVRQLDPIGFNAGLNDFNE
jgi:hypothetical protein